VTRLVSLITIPTSPAAMLEFVLGPVHAANGLMTLAAFALLALALIAVYDWQAAAAGFFGVVGLGAALIGTVVMTGDWWFEAFAVPWLADVSPGALDAVGGRLIVGGFASFVVLGIGWVLFGVASLRAHVFPTRISALILIGGLLSGVSVAGTYLLGGVILGAAIVWLGTWKLAATRAGSITRSDDAGASSEFQVVK
jgi:hypothetical protein